MNNRRMRRQGRRKGYQRLVQDLVDEAKIEPERLLTEDPAVVLEDGGQPVEEVDDQGGGDVELGGADKVQVVGLDEDELGPVNVLLVIQEKN